MTPAFLIVTLLFVIVSVTMILIILVQRPAGGGLAGAFGGAGGGGTETIFGGRVGDALTWATVVAFVVYLGVAIALNKMDSAPTRAEATPAIVDETGRPVEATPIDSPFSPEAPPAGDEPRIRIEPSAPPTGELPPELSPFAPSTPRQPAEPAEPTPDENDANRP